MARAASVATEPPAAASEVDFETEYRYLVSDLKRIGLLAALLGALALPLGIAGCKSEEEGTAEEAGKEVDKAAGEAQKEAEKAGESAKDALGDN